MIKYLLGLFKFLFNPAVSFFAKVDYKSIISRKANILSFVQFYDSSIGDYSYIGRHSKIVCAEIGKFCSISENVILGTASHTINYISTSPLFTEKNNGTRFSWVNRSITDPYKKVKVGNDVWVGTNAIIMGGCTIGDGAVIAAGAIVTKDVPPYGVVAGVPAKLIKYRFSPEIISVLCKVQWWSSSDEELKKSISVFQTEKIDTNSLNILLRD